MGAACCKRLDGQPTSPHLPFSEMVRRCARMICPVDPPQQKPMFRNRKYGLSDIVGPVAKKDGWAQTDPLPPPRHKRRSRLQRRRSRSMEFVPYLIRKGSRTSTASLEDIPQGHEDLLDFQIYFMKRLPDGSDGIDSLPERKKEFLTGLLYTENSSWPELVRMGEDLRSESPVWTKEKSAKGDLCVKGRTRTADLDMCTETAVGTVDLDSGAKGGSGTTDMVMGTKGGEETTAMDIEMDAKGGTVTGDMKTVGNVVGLEKETCTGNLKTDEKTDSTSRRSSITESLMEFETSLLEMLDEEEYSLKETNVKAEDAKYDSDIVIRIMESLNEKELSPLKEEEEDCVLSSPEDEEEIKPLPGIMNFGKNELKAGDNREYWPDLKPKAIHQENNVKYPYMSEYNPANIGNIINVKLKDKPPKITVEIVS